MGHICLNECVTSWRNPHRDVLIDAASCTLNAIGRSLQYWLCRGCIVTRRRMCPYSRNYEDAQWWTGLEIWSNEHGTNKAYYHLPNRAVFFWFWVSWGWTICSGGARCCITPIASMNWNISIIIMNYKEQTEPSATQGMSASLQSLICPTELRRPSNLQKTAQMLSLSYK